MVLIYLGTLDPTYSSARPQIIGSSCVSSLSETSFLKDNRSWGDIWYYYNILRSICPSSTREADRRWTGGGYADMDGRGGYIGEWLGGHDSTKGGQESLRKGKRDSSAICCYYCKEPGHTKYQWTLLKGKPARGAHIFATLPHDEKLQH